MSEPVQLIYQFSLTVPAGTAPGAPAVLPMALPSMEVVWVEWRVPPGPRGDVGFWIGSHGESIVPFSNQPNPWIVTDDEGAHWDLTAQMDSGDWELVAYNVGVRAHTVTVRFGLAPVVNQPTVSVVSPPLVSLSGTVPGT